MGNLYYRKDIKKWYVRIRYKGFEPISMAFEDLNDAKKFLEKTDKIIKIKRMQKKAAQLLIKFKEGKNGYNKQTINPRIKSSNQING